MNGTYIWMTLYICRHLKCQRDKGKYDPAQTLINNKHYECSVHM